MRPNEMKIQANLNVASKKRRGESPVQFFNAFPCILCWFMLPMLSYPSVGALLCFVMLAQRRHNGKNNKNDE